MNMALKVENLRKTYGELVAVDDLNFSMDSPGVFGLIGTNGAGKTTTIRMMLGLLSADAGTALWDGKPIRRETLSFGYMPEERGIYMKNRVGEQLTYFGMLKGMSRADAKASVSKWLDRLGVSEYADKNAEKLSKGNQQKIQLIAALVNDPILVVLDEPFSGLDPVNADLLREVIGEMVNAGKFVVMSSHQMAVVEEYCESLVLLHRGRAVLSGSLRGIKAGYGHTNLVVSGAGDTGEIAQNLGLVKLRDRADETEYRITGDEMAQAFLRQLVAAGKYPARYEIREPSLNEIFIEKAGDDR